MQKCRNFAIFCTMDQFKSTLKSNNKSITNVRLAVFAALTSTESLTMAELVNIIGASADRASVYRTIKLFEHLGIVQRVHIGWKHKLELSDRFAPHHHHFNCLSCGHHLPITNHLQLERDIAGLCAASNFTPTDHQLEIRGYCQNCQ